MTYSVVEIFKTLQGEGLHSGRSAIFVRFAGCNMWSGHDDDRERDAIRNQAQCPKWCDTDFLKGAKMGLKEIVLAADREGAADLVVFTGGEPLLQLDADLVEAFNREGYLTCVETNGTTMAKPMVLSCLEHVCVSPKLPRQRLKLIEQMQYEGRFKPSLMRDSGRMATTELKVVFPAYDPLHYDDLRPLFTRAYVSPEAETSSRGVSVLAKSNENLAADFCMATPGWGLSLQSHKYLGLE